MPGRNAHNPYSRRTDKHLLYQLAVQAPEEDGRFLARYFRRVSGRPLRVFREDFCGTALLSCEIVKQNRHHRAFGIDLDQPTLRWARQHNVAQLDPEQRQRIELVRGDVRDVRLTAADVIAALNFSYCVFKTRAELSRYLRNCRRGLTPGGLLLLDAWGGSDTQCENTDRRLVQDDNGGSFVYLWEQASFDPLTHHSTCKIHFEFKRGQRLRNAFVYDWRLWTLPELQELLAESGFRDVHVLWEGTDRSNNGNGVYRRVKRGEADPAWIAYVVGSA